MLIKSSKRYKWVKVFKIGPSKICERHLLKKLKKKCKCCKMEAAVESFIIIAMSLSLLMLTTTSQTYMVNQVPGYQTVSRTNFKVSKCTIRRIKLSKNSRD